MSNVINDVKGVGQTFSSWNSCMSKAYCKWPVIAAIILAALIVLSVLWCIFSCLCCGVSLCAAVGNCLTCGGCCGACRGGGGGGGRGRKRNDPEYHPMPPTPTPYQGYQPQPSPMAYNSGPQFATFDTGNKRGGNNHEDSLPAMPSWDTAVTRRVEDHPARPRGNEMEMEHMLSHSQQYAPTSPIREQSYPQRYDSDLGAQRMDQHRGHTEDYYDPPHQPLSPAPTYISNAPMGNTFPQSRQQFSPQPQLQPQPYHHHSPYESESRIQSSTAPYPSSRESTQFTAHRGISPPTAPSYTSYQTPSLEQSQNVRPPSLLQVGRKPVAASYRDV